MTRRWWLGIAFTSPWLLGMAAFLAYPILASLWYSFCSYSVLLPPVFVGFDNYAELAGDGLFWQSLWNTSCFAMGSVALGLVVSLGLAMLLNCRLRGQAVYRTLFFLPTLMPVVAGSMLWMWLFNADGGLINHLLGAIGIDGPTWLSNPFWIKPALILMTVWGAGHAMIIILAGLQDVPESLHEAALLDGANWWQRFRHITVPMLTPVLYFTTIMGIITGFQVFAQPFIMFGEEGGTGRAGLMYVLHLYNTAYGDLRMGLACAMAVILFVLVIGLTTAMHLISRRWVHYDR